MAADSNGVTGLVLSKRSMQDELKKSFEYLIRPDEGPELAAHVVRAAASGVEAREEPLTSFRKFLSRVFGWLTAAIWFLCQAALVAWATLAIYYSDLQSAG